MRIDTQIQGRLHAAVLFSALLMLAFLSGCTSVTNTKPISSAQNSASIHSLRLKGATEAVHSRDILAPVLSGQQMASLTVTKLMPAGSRVKRGDLLAEFDGQTQMRDFLDKQAEYEKYAGQVVGEQAKETATRAKDETELHQAESDLKSAELEMKRQELLSRIDVEKAQQTLEQAKANLQQLKETFDLKRSAARASIRMLEIQRDRSQQTMLNAQKNAELMKIRAPLDGVVVLNMVWKQGSMGEAQEGDQLHAGMPFMQVVDPSLMQVQVQVNQEDVLGLQVGQAAKVRLDAYPDLVLDGKLEQIAPVARVGSFSAKVKTFTAVFSVQGSDARLMPDLSAAVDIQPSVNKQTMSAQR